MNGLSITFRLLYLLTALNCLFNCFNFLRRAVQARQKMTAEIASTESSNPFNFNSFLTTVPDGEEIDRDDVDFVEDEIAWESGSDAEEGDELLAEQFADDLDAILAEEFC